MSFHVPQPLSRESQNEFARMRAFNAAQARREGARNAEQLRRLAAKAALRAAQRAALLERRP